MRKTEEVRLYVERRDLWKSLGMQDNQDKEFHNT